VRPTGHNANTASTSKTCLFALLSASLPFKGSGALSTRLTGRVSLGRRAAVKTFTRNNNKGVMSRIGRQATTKRLSTKHGRVAHLRNARFLLPPLALAGLLFTATSALAAAPEAPRTEPVSAVTATTATLNGVLNPGKEGGPGTFELGEYEFLYNQGSSCKGGSSAPESPAISLGGGMEGVSQPVGALQAGTEYTVCLLARTGITKGEQEAVGPSEHFTTAIQPETPEVIEPESISGTEEVLKGVVNPNAKGNPGSYQFVYLQSTSECERYNENQEVFEIVNETEPKTSLGEAKEAAEAPVEKLLPGATYTFCLLAHNEAGEESGLSSPETFTMPAEAPMISGEYVTKVQFKAATLNAQIDPKGAKTSYFFEYGTTKTYGTTTPEAALAGSLTATDTATATIPGLEPGTTYHYRVVAASEVKPGKIEDFDGNDATFTTPTEPGSAPETCPNAQARTEQPYGQALPDCRAYELVSPLYKNDRGVEAVDSRASVSDEAPAIAYQATGSFSGAGTPGPQGAEQVNRYISRREAAGWSTQNIQPRGIAYESGKRGNGAFSELLFTPDLSAGVLFSEAVALVGGEAPGFDNLYAADLAANPVSYQTVSNVNPPNVPPYTESRGTFPEAAGASADLSHVVFQQAGNLTANAEGTAKHVYEWAAGELRLVDVPYAGASFVGIDQIGAPSLSQYAQDAWHAVSSDGLRVFFTAGENAPFQSPAETGQLYVREVSEAKTVEVSASQRTNCNVQRKAKEPNFVCNGNPELDPNSEHVVEESFPPHTLFTLLTPAYYRDASTDGSRMFFTSRAELTNNANTGPDDNTANLYEYNLETKELTDLTAPTEAEDPNGAAVLGLVTAGENAGEENSYVYFVADGVLASNENANGETAKHGSCKEEESETPPSEPTCSLYMEHYDGAAWEPPRFIAMLSGNPTSEGAAREDETDWVGLEGGSFDLDQGPGQHTARVTPDGTTLAFESERSLTGYDNEPVEPGGTEGHSSTDHACTRYGGEVTATDSAVPCREVYLYDAVTGKLVCASCDPSGARPAGPAELGGKELDETGNSLTLNSPFYLPRNLSESGGRLFFQSPDPLVPHDSNNQTDVYEWERVGATDSSGAEAANAENSCTSSSPTFTASDGGCVFPISDVAGDFESKFMDAGASGSDVFIATKDQLVPAADGDSRANVYDVRVDGGFPVSVPPPPCNNGDACKPPVSPQPGVFAVPASATFSGPGNPVPAVAPPPPKKTTKTVKCKKRKKLEHGKCVVRHVRKKNSRSKKAKK
jgi:hypothetical protein